MRTSFWGFLVLAMTLVFSHAASAGLDVVCVRKDCLKNGWSAHNPYNGYWFEVRCLQKDCAKNGWTMVDSVNGNSTAECFGKGCFVDGWVERLDMQPGYSQTNICRSGDDPKADPNCFTYGWETSNGRGRGETICRGEDCAARGWVVRFPGQPDVVVVCKAGGCFVDGWSVNP